jgi:hypothetical protein
LGAESVLGLARFDYSKTKYIPPDYFAAMKRGVVEDRDVLLYKDGGRPGEFEPHVAVPAAPDHTAMKIMIMEQPTPRLIAERDHELMSWSGSAALDLSASDPRWAL